MERKRQPWLEGLAVGFAALLVLLVMDAYVRDSPAPQGDELIYELMARGWQLMAAPPPVDEVRVRLHHADP